MFCKNCGKLLGSDDKFCAECGTKVTVERPKAATMEPMFFVEKREEPVIEKKPKRVIHLDEFNWNLDGYPTENRKTEDVDFDWASVLEEKGRKPEPKPVQLNPEPKGEKREPLEGMPKSVEELLATLPDNVLEIVEEPVIEAEEPVIEEPATEKTVAEEPVAKVEEVVEPKPELEASVETEEKEIEVKSLEQIIEDFGEGPMEEPTRLIDKAQMKTDSVDRFYVFSKKQAEYQNLLDQEYDKIQNSLLEKEEEETTAPTVEEILAATPATEEHPAGEPVEEPAEEDAEEASVVETPVIPIKELELVAIAWSMPPAGIVVEKEAVKKTAGKDTLMQETKVLMAELEKLMPEDMEGAAEDAAVEAPEEAPDAKEPAEPTEETTAESAGENTEKEQPKETITFADIFNDEDEEENQPHEGGGCLKFIAVALIIMVIIELGILGIQYFAKDSEAAKVINQTYGKIVDMITGNESSSEETPIEEAPASPTETEMLIAAQKEKNTNIAEVVENTALTFEAGKDYGYEELADTYAFKNSPWYETEDGKEVTYGDEIIGTLIQYYSALPDKINDVNKDVLDYVDNTTALYEELDALEGDETKGYVINRLEIGEIKTGQMGFYIIVSVTSADKLQPEETQQKQLVYLEANPNKRMILIKETKNI